VEAVPASDTVEDGDGRTAEDAPTAEDGDGRTAAVASVEGETEESAAAAVEPPTTLSDHIDAVIGADTGEVRLLDAEMGVIAEGPAADTVSLVESADSVPQTIVLDDTCTQKVLDVAAQRGVEVVVATGEGEYVKQPTSVRVRTV
jgi:hypothetical protein